MLEEEGISPIHDRDLISTVERELAEACNMSQSEMDEAAHRLLQANQGETPLPYFDHLGGYELQDYTQRSSPHEHSRSREGRLRLNSESTNHEEEDDDDDDDDDDVNDETPKPKETDRDMVYVTTL